MKILVSNLVQRKLFWVLALVWPSVVHGLEGNPIQDPPHSTPLTHAMVGCFTEPRRDVSMSMPVSGRVLVVGAREGETVAPGRLLLRLEDHMQRLKVGLARHVAEDGSQLGAAKVKEKNEKFLLAMFEELHGKNRSISLEEMEKKRLEAKVAALEREHLEYLKNEEKISFQVEEEELKKLSLFSPMAGVVLRQAMEVGETAQANQVVVRVADTKTGLLICNLEEKWAKHLAPGGVVRLKLQTMNAEVQREGKVVFLSPVMDVASGLVEVKVEFDNTHQPVRLGAPGQIEIPDQQQ
ncbi:MAG: efflux RND transporter periplasmic adaptor subunit [Magnetococcales bacterium]|nr:efflux RND transporter periplasmic adaptor subunit [Magnetococcales bacterium]MBF0322413.1 efflux RND transporter periplasmic adaptor subunit [Magnetococcales bacterium]